MYCIFRIFWSRKHHKPCWSLKTRRKDRLQWYLYHQWSYGNWFTSSNIFKTSFLKKFILIFKKGTHGWTYLILCLLSTKSYTLYAFSQRNSSWFKTIVFLFYLLLFLHKKTRNLLLNKNCDLKVCDLGLCRGFENENELKTEYYTLI